MTRTSSTFVVLTCLIATLILSTGCEPREDEEILAFLEDIEFAQTDLMLKANQTETIYPHVITQNSQEFESTFTVYRKGQTTVRTNFYTQAPLIAQWKSEQSTGSEPGTGDAHYLNKTAFEVRDPIALARAYRLQIGRIVDWEGRPAREIKLTPLHRLSYVYRLVVDSASRVIVSAESLDSFGNPRHKTVLRDIVYLDKLPPAIESKVNRARDVAAYREREHQSTLILGIEEAQLIVPGFDIPTDLPAGYRLRELREYVDEHSVHGVVAEFTDGSQPLLMYARPHTTNIDLGREILGASQHAQPLPGSRVGEESSDLRRDPAQQDHRILVLHQNEREVGFFSYKVIAAPLDLNVLTTLPSNEIRQFFSSLPLPE